MEKFPGDLIKQINLIGNDRLKPFCSCQKPLELYLVVDITGTASDESKKDLADVDIELAVLSAQVETIDSHLLFVFHYPQCDWSKSESDQILVMTEVKILITHLQLNDPLDEWKREVGIIKIGS